MVATVQPLPYCRVPGCVNRGRNRVSVVTTGRIEDRCGKHLRGTVDLMEVFDAEEQRAQAWLAKRAGVRAAISDAYYDIRNAGGTMEDAADAAAERVMRVLAKEN